MDKFYQKGINERLSICDKSLKLLDKANKTI